MIKCIVGRDVCRLGIAPWRYARLSERRDTPQTTGGIAPYKTTAGSEEVA